MAGRGALPTASGPRLLRLPYELVNGIADLLSRTDLENFRLSSKKIAECTQPLLALAHFNGVPWRQDGIRLHELAFIPACARRIRSVKFNMARMNKYDVEDAISQIEDPLELAEKWGPYLSTQGQAEQPVCLPLESVIPALMLLPNLDSLCLTWVEGPWEEYVDIDNWFSEEVSMDLAGREVLEAQQSILEALLARNVPLTTLTLEPLMHPELTMPSSLDERVQNVFGSITQLNLSLDYNVSLFMPKRLDYFISLMPHIRELRLHAWPVEDEAEDVDFFIRKKLEHLEKIDFSCLHFSFVLFAAFLMDHSRTLKQMNFQSLYGFCDPIDGIELDWDLLFLLMKDKLATLESIRIRGTFRDDKGWCQMFYHDDDPHADIHRRSQRLVAEESSRLERFILEGGEYPQPEWRR